MQSSQGNPSKSRRSFRLSVLIHYAVIFILHSISISILILTSSLTFLLMRKLALVETVTGFLTAFSELPAMLGETA